MIVYLITNKTSNKKYIGITIRPLKSRINEHKSCKTKSAVHDAIVKYGIEQFTIEQIDTAETYKELLEKEIYWIEKLGTFGKNGYNLTRGGEGSLGRIATEETRTRLSEGVNKSLTPERIEHLSNKTTEYFQNNPEKRAEMSKKISKTLIGNQRAKGKKHKNPRSKETRQQISNKLKGRIFSETTKQKISETKKKNYKPENNAMNNPENRKKVGLSKIGKKKFRREDGSSYMAYPDNPIDPKKA